MTDAVWLAMITALPATIAAVAGLIVSLRNGRKSDKIEEKVNSTATAQQAKVDALQAQVVALTATMAERKEIAAILAAALVEKERKV